MPLVPAKCTQCGANIEIDDTKEAGICKYCGTAFITEKAINNYNTYVTNNNNFAGANINVMGADVKNLIILGDNAAEVNNFEEANQYYSRALECDPNNRAALIGKGVTACLQGRISDANAKELVSYAERALTGCEDRDFIKKSLDRIENVSTTFLAGALQIYSENSKHKQAFDILVTGMGASIDTSYFEKNQLEKMQLHKDEVFLENYKNAVKSCVNLCVQICQERQYVDSVIQGPFVSTENKANIKIGTALHEKYLAIYEECCEIAKKIDPSYNPPSINKQKEVSDGCYIATCVYGSYDCPQVWTLRRFRDYTLDETWYGRLFIKCYYATSPTLVKWFGNTKWFRKFWKSKLDKMVSDLNNKGVKDTYYKDKY